MSRTSLLKKVQTPSNLRKAWAELNKSNPYSYGLSSETINTFGKSLESNLKVIRKQLRHGSYNFSPVRGVVATKRRPSGKIKKRGLRIAEIKDRVVQRAITRVIEPLLSKEFNLRNEASFAYLRGRGVRPAIMRMILLYRQHNPYVFEADIEKFFDTVDRDKLLCGMVFPHLPDDSLNQLIKQSLEQEVGNWETISRDYFYLFPETGIPQGGGLSPLLANIYLSDFDEKMLRAGFGLIRYADDFVVMAKDETQAEKAYEMSRQILETDLKLKMHPLSRSGHGKTRIIRVTEGQLEFLGIRYNGQRIWPSTERLKEVKSKIREITEFEPNKNLRQTLSGVNNVIRGWLSAYSFTNIEPYLGDIQSFLGERVGICAHKMGWIYKRSALSPRQYRFSGFPDLNDFLVAQRETLSSEKKEIFGIAGS